MLDWSTCTAVERTPDKVSGAWVFRGTRILVKALFENLEDNASVDEFLEWFPDVSKDQVDAVLEHATRSLEQRAKRGSRKAFDTVLRKVPDVSPEEQDRF
jgi:uncharacterized protein (DUF433 family)